MTHFPILTVDIVLLTLKDEQLQVVLVKREHEPFQGAYALPGGFVHPEEDADVLEAAMRVLRTKTGIESPYLEQLEVFSGATRDPRGWSVSAAHFALVSLELIERMPMPGVRLAPVDARLKLPFDHGAIVQAAVARLRRKGQYSSLPCLLAGETFTLAHLQRVYELVLGRDLHKGHFRRKLDEMGVLEPVPGETRADGAHRPAQVYRLKSAFRQQPHLLDRGL